MKKITTHDHKIKLALQEQPEPEIQMVEQSINQIEAPDNVKSALLTSLQECEDPYFQTYIRALPKDIRLGEQIGQVQSAIISQLHYIYSNMEYYQNEEIKNIIADFLKIPLEDRHEPRQEEYGDDTDLDELV